MAETIPSTSDFDALTADYTPKVLVDNIMVGTPTLLKLKDKMISVTGRAWTPLLEYAIEDGEWYNEGGQVGTPTTPSTQIAMRGKFVMQFYRRKVLLNAQATDQQGSLAIVEVLAAHVKSASKALQKNLGAKSFTGLFDANPAQLGGLEDALDPAHTWGGLDPATYKWWVPHWMEGSSTYSVPVSPSIENVSKLGRRIQNTTDELPDIVVVDEDYHDILMAQITRTQYDLGLAAHRDADTVKWGFKTLWIDEMPVVADRNCSGATWVAAQGTRVAAAGHQGFLLNFNHLKMAYNPKRSWKWDPDGWRRPTDYDQYLNYIYFWGTIGGDARRTQGRIYNVDLAQAPADWAASAVSLIHA